jgi:hypothetical protein
LYFVRFGLFMGSCRDKFVALRFVTPLHCIALVSLALIVALALSSALSS